MQFGKGADELVCVSTRSTKVFNYKWEDVVGGVSESFAECGLVCCVAVSAGTVVKGVGVGGVG